MRGWGIGGREVGQGEVGSGWLLWAIQSSSSPLLYPSYAGIHIRPAHHRFLLLLTAICQGFPGLPFIRIPCILGALD